MILAALLTLSLAHAFLVARVLWKLKAPPLTYITVVIWFLAWPLKSLRSVWQVTQKHLDS